MERIKELHSNNQVLKKWNRLHMYKLKPVAFGANLICTTKKGKKRKMTEQNCYFGPEIMTPANDYIALNREYKILKQECEQLRKENEKLSKELEELHIRINPDNWDGRLGEFGISYTSTSDEFPFTVLGHQRLVLAFDELKEKSNQMERELKLNPQPDLK